MLLNKVKLRVNLIW